MCLVDWCDCKLVDWSIGLLVYGCRVVFGDIRVHCVCLYIGVCLDGWIGELLCWCGGPLGVLASWWVVVLVRWCIGCSGVVVCWSIDLLL